MNDEKVISSNWITVKTFKSLWGAVKAFNELTDNNEPWYIGLSGEEKEDYARDLEKCCEDYCEKYVKNENAEFLLQRSDTYGRAYYSVLADGKSYCSSPVGGGVF